MSKIQLNALVLIVVLSLSLYGAKSGKRLSTEGRPNTTFEAIPLHLNEWSGIESRFSEDNYRLLPSASLLLRYYEHDEYPLTELAIVYGTDLGDFHQPEFCLEGQGLRTLDKKGVRVQAEDESVDAVAMIMDSSFGKRAFLYWFASEGATDTSLGNYKIKIFFDRLRGRTVQPSAMIRLSTEVPFSDQDAIDQLVVFAEEFWPYLKEEFMSK